LGRRYSWNEGATWIPYVFSAERLRIHWVTTDPDATSRAFLLYGEPVTSAGSGGSSGPRPPAYPRLIKIDITGLHERRCTADDFETWVLESPSGQCVLGRQVCAPQAALMTGGDGMR
jgi:hypothetical protein